MLLLPPVSTLAEWLPCMCLARSRFHLVSIYRLEFETVSKSWRDDRMKSRYQYLCLRTGITSVETNLHISCFLIGTTASSSHTICRKGTAMPRTRREFLTYSSLGMLTAALEAASAQTPGSSARSRRPAHRLHSEPRTLSVLRLPPPPLPRLKSWCQVEMRPADREQAASNWRMQMAPSYEFRVGTAQGRSRRHARARHAVESGAARLSSNATANRNAITKRKRHSFAAPPVKRLCHQATKPSPMPPWPNFRAGSKPRR